MTQAPSKSVSSFSLVELIDTVPIDGMEHWDEGWGWPLEYKSSGTDSVHRYQRPGWYLGCSEMAVQITTGSMRVKYIHVKDRIGYQVQLSTYHDVSWFTAKG